MTNRKLGHSESLMSVMHDLMGGTTQSSQLTTVEGAITYEAFRAATVLVLRKYSVLRCTIERQNDELCFVQHEDASRIPIAHVAACDGDEFIGHFLRETNTSLVPSKAICRFTLVDGAHPQVHGIIFVCHHAAIDNAGFIEVINDLLCYINAGLAGREVDVQPIGLPRAVDDFLLPPLPDQAETKVACFQTPHSSSAPLAERRTSFVAAALTADEHRVLSDACSVAHVKLNSVLSAALCMAAVNTGLAQDPVSFKTAVSLRDLRFVEKESTNTLGCYVAVADADLSTSDRSVMQVAAEYENKLVAYVLRVCSRKQEFVLANLSKGIAGLKHSKYFTHGFGMTNLGKVEVGRRLVGLKVTDYDAMAKRVAGNHAFVLHVIDFQDRLKFLFVYTEPLINRDRLELLCSAFLTELSAFR